ncbi:MAG: glycosyltransferase [Nitriliruptor sp.]|nr:MAG: glycosyltransferase [Nitriliruptor sp.]
MPSRDRPNLDLRRRVQARLTGRRHEPGLAAAAGEVRASGIFDASWYLAQAGADLADGQDPVEHYLRAGAQRGHSPSPLFDARTYTRTHRGARRTRYGPLVHYLRRGIARRAQPHPVFDVDHYLGQSPDAVDHPGGPLGHYLEVGWRAGHTINTWFDEAGYLARHPHTDAPEPVIVTFLRRAAPRIAAIADHRDFRRQYRTFDQDRASAFLARHGAARSEDGPLVSVVMPVRDRADTVATAIGSVLSQSHRQLELLVVDDGSVDGSPQVVEAITDPRVRLLRQPPGGVCRARNHALSLARGSFVAYLDADNRWEPEFLAVMVDHLLHTGAGVAYSALEMEDRGETVYRGVDFDRAALLEANYIDVNTLVHRRALVEQVGEWDEDLPRANDWDYVLRLSEVSDVRYAPFVGVRYSHDRDRGDRISVREPLGHRMRVYAKHNLRWEEALARPSIAGRTSVVIWHADASGDLARCLQRLVEQAPPDDLEVIVVDDSRRAWHRWRVLELEDRFAPVRVLSRTWMQLGAPISLNLGILDTTGDVIVLLDQTALVRSGWWSPLVAPLREGRVRATQGPWLSFAGSIESTGYAAGVDGLPYPFLAGFPVDGPEARTSGSRAALCRALLAARREDLLAVRGLDPRYRAVLADVDLSARLRSELGGPLEYRAGPGAAAGRVVEAPTTAIRHQDQAAFLDRWVEGLHDEERGRWEALGLQITHRVRSSSPWVPADAHEPHVVYARDRDRPLRWAIKIGAPDVLARERWGDRYFAEGLQAALRRLGHEAVIDLHGAWERPSAHLDDVVVVLRGRERHHVAPDQVNLLWLISHPDEIDDGELRRYDRLFVASGRFASKLEIRLRRPVYPLLQCTDRDRFRPDPDATPGDSVVFVGNSKGILRPVVRDALAAGIDVQVYGAWWRGRIPEENWAASHVPNDELAHLYRSSGLVLNDHWDDMRREAFLSNRLFDLAACGATVVSDHVDGIEEVFDGLVATYAEPSELPGVVERALAERSERFERRQVLAQRIRTEHSFDARAATLDAAANEVLSERTGSGARSGQQRLTR